MEISTIIPNKLYQSGLLPLRGLEYKRKLLSQYGITIVVNLSHTPDQHLEHWGGAYYHYVIEDDQIPPEQYLFLERLADLLADAIQDGACVLCHCAAGLNRSGLLNALIVMRLLGIPGGQAIELIRERRGQWALCNPYFVQYLEEVAPLLPTKGV